MRKYMEKKGIEYKPVFFDEWKNPDDPAQNYYKYNGKYFESERKEKNWSRCPDLYTDKLPDDFESIEVSIKDKENDKQPKKK